MKKISSKRLWSALAVLLFCSVVMSGGCGDEDPDVIIDGLLVSQSDFLKAVVEGDVETVRKAIGENVDVNVQDEESRTALSLSIIHNQVEVAELLLNADNLEVNKEGPQDTTALIYAAQYGTEVAIVDGLLKKTGLELNAIEAVNGSSALIVIVRRETVNDQAPYLEVFKSIASKNGTNLNLVDEDEKPALYYAAKDNRDPEVVGHLLSLDGLKNHNNLYEETDGDLTLTPLAWALVHNRVEVIQNLLEDATVVSQVNELVGAKTPLMHVEDRVDESTRVAAVRALLNVDILDVNKTDAEGDAALTLAVKNDRAEVVRALLTHGDIDVNLSNRNEETSLILATKHTTNVDIIDQLLGEGNIEVNAQDQNDKTALHHAVLSQNGVAFIQHFISASKIEGKLLHLNLCTSSNETALKLLRDRAVDDASGFTLADKQEIEDHLVAQGATEDCDYFAIDASAQEFLSAAANGDVEGVEAAIQGRVDLRVIDVDRNTALILAAGNGRRQVVDVLLEQTATEVNAANEAGVTALILAANRGYYLIVETLLQEADIEVNQKDDEGNAALTVAARAGHDSVLAKLLEHEDIDVNTANLEGETAFYFAAGRIRTLDVIRKFLTHTEFNSHGAGPAGSTPLVNALLNNVHEVVTVLVENTTIEGDVNNPVGGYTPLIHLLKDRTSVLDADGNLDADLVQATAKVIGAFLRTPDIEVNLVDGEGKAALHHALLSQNAWEPIQSFLKTSRARRKGLLVNLCVSSNTALALFNNRAVDDASGFTQTVKEYVKNEILGVDDGNDQDEDFDFGLILACGDEVLLPEIYTQAEFLAAVKGGDVNTVFSAVQQDGTNKIEVNTDAAGNNPLIIAIDSNHVEIIKELLKATGILVDQKDAIRGDTPLIIAVKKDLGEGEVVKALLDASATVVPPLDINAQGDEGNTALIIAVAEGKIALASTLLEEPGHNAAVASDGGETAFYLAAKYITNVDLIEKFLTYPGFDGHVAGLTGSTPLIAALVTVNNNLEVVRTLLADATIAATINTLVGGLTPLHHLLSKRIAAATGDVITLLLTVPGLEVNKVDASGKTALHHAVSSQHDLQAIVALLEGVALSPPLDINLCVNSKTALQLLRRRYLNPIAGFTDAARSNIETALVNSGASLCAVGDHLLKEASTDEEETFLNNAELGDADAVQAALSQVSVNVFKSRSLVPGATESHYTALMLAAYNGHADVVEKLLTIGAVDVEYENDRSENALILAIRSNDLDLLRTFLASDKVNINHLNSKRESAFYHAASRPSVELQRLFLDHADFAVHNEGPIDNTPLIRALVNNVHEVVSVLLKDPKIAATVNAPVGSYTPLVHLLRQRSTALDSEGNVDATGLQATADMISTLLRTTGIDVNILDGDDKTALHHAVLFQNGWKPIQALLEGSRASRLDLKINLCVGGKTALVLLNDRAVDDRAGFTQTVKNTITDGLEALTLTETCGEEVLQHVLYTQAQFLEAVENNDVNKVVSALQQVDNDAVNVNTGDPIPPILIAAKNGYVGIVDVLVAGTFAPPLAVNVLDAEENTPLILAAKEGHANAAQVLLRASDINVNVQGEGDSTALIVAAKEGYETLVDALLAVTNINVNLQEENQNTALILAINGSRQAIIKSLLTAQNLSPLLDPNIKGANDNTALIRAVFYGNEEAVDALLAVTNINVNVKGENDNTPLIAAVVNNRASLVTTLLDATNLVPPIDASLQTKIDAEDQTNGGNTALILAVRDNRQEIIAQLLEFDPNNEGATRTDAIGINAINAAGESAFFLLVSKTDDLAEPTYATDVARRVAFIQKFFDYPGFNGYVSGPTDDSSSGTAVVVNTPLIEAAVNNSVEVVRALLGSPEIVATINTKVGLYTPLIYVFRNRTSVLESDGSVSTAYVEATASVVRELLAVTGIDVNIVGDDGQTALHHAVLSQNALEPITELLKKEDLSVNLCTIGDTPATALSLLNERTVTEATIDAGFTADVKTSIGTALGAKGATSECSYPDVSDADFLSAATNGDLATINQAILNGGTTLNVVNSDGNTALILAVKGEHTAVVNRLLEEALTNASVQGEAGNTALIAAVKTKNTIIITKLLELDRSGEGNDKTDEVNINAVNAAGETALYLVAKTLDAGYLIKAILAYPDFDSAVTGPTDSTTPLVEAVVNNSFDVIAALRENADIAASINTLVDGLTPLHHVLSKRTDATTAEKVEATADVIGALLLTENIEVNTADASGKTALHHAVLSQNALEPVRRFLVNANGVQVNLCVGGRTALRLLQDRALDATTGFTQEVQEAISAELVKQKGVLNCAASSEDAINFLSFASEGNINEVKKALDGNSQLLNVIDVNRNTALLLAARNSHQEVVELLLGTDDVETVQLNSYGYNFLSIATFSSVNPAILNLALASEKVDLNAKNLKGKTTLYLHAEEGGAAQFKVLNLQKLLDHPRFTTHNEGPEGSTPLIAALLRETDVVPILSILLANSQIVGAVNTPVSGLTPLAHLLSKRTDVLDENDNVDATKVTATADVITTFLGATGIEVNTADASGKTALHHAVLSQNALAPIQAFLDGSRAQNLPLKINLCVNVEDIPTTALSLLDARKLDGETEEGDDAPEPEAATGVTGDGDAEEPEATGFTEEVKTSIRTALEDFGFTTTCGDEEGLPETTHTQEEFLAAVKRDDANVVGAALHQSTSPINVNLADETDGKTPLIVAAESGYEGVIGVLLKASDIRVNEQGTDKNTALIAAVKGDHPGVVQALLRAGGLSPALDVNLKGENGNTALIVAVNEGHTSVALALLGADGLSPALDVNLKGENDNTALIIAAKAGNQEAVEALLGITGINVNLKGEDDNTALIVASSQNREPVVEALVAAEDLSPALDANLKNTHGNTALYWAARNNAETVVAALLRITDINVNLKGENDNTALHWAARSNSETALDVLLGATDLSPALDVNLKNTHGNTALALASRLGYTAIVTKLLGVAETDATLSDTFGNTALILAIKEKHTEVPKVFLDLDRSGDGNERTDEIGINAANGAEETALYLAAKSINDADLITKILNYHAFNSHNAGPEDSTPLIAALLNNSAAVVAALLANDAIAGTINTRVGGLTPLHHLLSTRTDAADATATANVLSALLNVTDRDVNIADDEGKTALHHAVSSQNALVPISTLSDATGLNINLCVGGKTAFTLLADRALDATNGFTQEVKQTINAALVAKQASADCSYPAVNDADFLSAATNGDLTTINQAIRNGETTLNVVNSDGNTALILAVKAGHTAIIERLLQEAGTEAGLKGEAGNTALIVAIKEERTDIITKLLALDRSGDGSERTDEVNINAVNDAGETALYLVAKSIRNHALITDILAYPEFSSPVAGPEGSTPLIAAVLNNSATVVEALLANDAIKGTINTLVGGLTPLHHLLSKRTDAATSGVLIELFEVATLEVNTADATGKTALHHAVLSQNTLAPISDLIDRGASKSLDYNLCVGGETALALLQDRALDDTNGFTQDVKDAVRSALEDKNGGLNCVAGSDLETEFLADAGDGNIEEVRTALADHPQVLNVLDEDGNTALMLAVNGNHYAVIELLLGTDNVKVTQEDARRQTALMIAVYFGDITTLNTLLKHDNVDINHLNSQGESAFYILAKVRTSLEHLQAFLSHPNFNGHNVGPVGSTPLIVALLNNSDRTVHALLGNSQIVGAVNTPVDGLTPLAHLLSKRTDATTPEKVTATASVIATFLGATGIEVNTADASGKTALHHAVLSQNALAPIQAFLDGSRANGLPLQINICVNVEDIPTTALSLLDAREADDANGFTQDVKTDIKTALEGYGLTATCGDEEGLPETTHTQEEFLAAVKSDEANVVGAALHQTQIFINVNLADETDGKTPLIVAAESGYVGVIEVLLKASGIRVNEQGTDKNTALIAAVKSRSTGVVQALLGATDINVNLKGDDGNTALIVAARAGNTEVVDELLKIASINVNLKNDEKNTALIVASSQDKETVVQALLDADGLNPVLDVNLKGRDGAAALHWATRRNREAIVPLLLSATDINVNLKGDDGNTALILAIRDGHTNIASTLLDVTNIDALVKGENGNTALLLAVKGQHTTIVDKLVDLDRSGDGNERTDEIDINAVNTAEETALTLASSEGYTAIVTKLLTAVDLDASLPDGDGNTALILAVKGNHATIVDKLVDLDRSGDGNERTDEIDINAVNAADETAFYLAAKSIDNSALITKFLNYPELSSPNAGAEDSTPLIAALVYNSVEVVRALVKNTAIAASINTEVDGLTPLMHLLSKRTETAETVNVVRELLAVTDIDVNKADEDGKTALHHAVLSRKGELVIDHFFDDAGLNANLCVGGKTALTLLADRAVDAANGFTEDVKNGLHTLLVDHQATADCSYPAVSDEDFLTAATNGDLTTIDQAIKSGEADLNAVNTEENTALILAVKAGHTAIIERLLQEAGTNASVQGEGGNTALIVAIKEERTEIITKLLELDRSGDGNERTNEVGINAANDAGETALYLVAKSINDHALITDILAYPGFSSPVAGPEGSTPLIAAVLNNSYSVLAALLDNTDIVASINTLVGGLTPLHHLLSTRTTAAEGGATASVVLTLLGATDINVNIADGEGKAAIHHAVSSQNAFEPVRILLNNAGSDLQINLCTSGEDTPTTALSLLNDREVTEATIAAGFTEEVKSAIIEELVRQDAALNCAATSEVAKKFLADASSGNIDDVRTALAANSQLLNVIDEAGETALMKAAYNSKREVVELLLGTDGVETTQLSIYRENFLSTAALSSSDPAILDLALASDKVDLNAKNLDGKTTLYLHVENGLRNVNNGRPDLVKPLNLQKLLSHPRFNAHNEGPEGSTPLIAALLEDNSEVTILSILLANSQIVGAVNTPVDGLTPLAHLLSKRTDVLDENDNVDATKVTATASVIARLLLTENIEVNTADASGKTALHHAVLSQNALEPIQAFLDGSRANGLPLQINLCVNVEATPTTALSLLDARELDDANGFTQDVKTSINTALVGYGLTTTCGGDDRLTETTHTQEEFLAAVKRDDANVVGAALHQSTSPINVNLVDEVDGKTPLIVAADSGYEGVIGVLLKASDIRVNEQGTDKNTALIAAVKKEHTSAVQTLLGATNIDVNLKGENGNTALYWAVFNNNAELLSLLLGVATLNPNVQDADGKTVLHRAVERSETRESTLKTLLGATGINVNVQDDDDKTPLHLVSVANNQQILRVLLAAADLSPSLDPNLKDEDGKTALHLAVDNNSGPLVRQLLGATGINVNLQDEADGQEDKTALHLAVDNNSRALVEILLFAADLSPALDPNLKDKDEKTALHLAVGKRSPQLVRQLLGATGINVNLQDATGKTALMLAVSRAETPILNVFLAPGDLEPPLELNLEPGLDPNVQDDDGNTILHLVIIARFGVDVLNQVLLATDLEPALDPNLQDATGKTALMLAVKTAANEAVFGALLGVTGINVNLKDAAGNTALHSAVEGGSERLVGYLLGVASLNPNLKDDDDKTALHLAVEKVSGRLVSQLLAATGLDTALDPNLKDEDGNTALILALIESRDALVNPLLERTDIDASVQGSDGKTALILAVEKRNDAVVTKLLDLDRSGEGNDKTDEVNINALNSDGKTALILALTDRNSELALDLLDYPEIDANAQGSEESGGKTALILAVEEGYDDVVTALLALERTNADGDRIDAVNINAKTTTESGRTALILALNESLDAVALELLEHPDIDATLQDAYGETALMAAAWAGYADVVTALLALDRSGEGNAKIDEVNINAQYKRSRKTALVVALSQGRSAIALQLLEREDIDATLQDDVKGLTALIAAVEKGYEDVVTKLLALDRSGDSERTDEVNINAKTTENGVTALIWAVKLNRPEIALELLEHPDIDASLQDKGGATALIAAVGEGLSTVVTELLTLVRKNDAGESIDAVNINAKSTESGNTALILALRVNRPEIATKLLEVSNIDASLKATDKNTALIWAIKERHPVIAKALLEIDHSGDSERTDEVNINAVNDAGETAFYWAAKSSRDITLIQQILNYPTFNSPNLGPQNSSPLVAALVHNNVRVVEVLLANDAIKGTINTKVGGLTPLIHLLKDRAAVANSEGVVNTSDVEFTRSLVSALLAVTDIEVNILGDDGKTALHHAVQAQNALAPITELLKKDDLSVNLCTIGESPATALSLLEAREANDATGFTEGVKTSIKTALTGKSATETCYVE